MEETYGNVYSTKNVLLSATHTHSGPGGFTQYFLFTLASQGFVKQTLDSLVDGIVLVITKIVIIMLIVTVSWIV